MHLKYGPIREGGLWWEWPDKRGWFLVEVALYEGVAFGGSGFWWEWPYKRGGLCWEWPLVGVALYEGGLMYI